MSWYPYHFSIRSICDFQLQAVPHPYFHVILNVILRLCYNSVGFRHQSIVALRNLYNPLLDLWPIVIGEPVEYGLGKLPFRPFNTHLLHVFPAICRKTNFNHNYRTKFDLMFLLRKKSDFM